MALFLSYFDMAKLESSQHPFVTNQSCMIREDLHDLPVTEMPRMLQHRSTTARIV